MTVMTDNQSSSAGADGKLVWTKPHVHVIASISDVSAHLANDVDEDFDGLPNDS